VRRRIRRFAIVVAIATSLLGLVWWRGARIAAHIIIDAPNAGREAFPPMQGEWRVEVAAPPASIAFDVEGPPDARATVLVLHGIRDSRVSMGGWGSLLASAGIRAVLVDLRGHGRSTGDVLSYGVFDAADLARVVDELTARGLLAGRVGALGVSYGAATAIEWAGSDPRVERVVAIAPFASLAEVVPGYAPVPVPDAFARYAVALAGEMGGFDPARASPLDAIARTRAAVLLFHGTDDDRIPPRHAEELHAASPDHSTLVLVPGATHDTIGDDPSGELRARVIAWLGALRD
jgi:pimeloyl-ACP methyl ester carboxylesterase